MCDATAVVAGISALVGVGSTIYGNQQQKKEIRRANAANEKAAKDRAILRNMMDRDNADLANKRNDAIVREAEEVAPMNNREALLNSAIDERTKSNVEAMQQAGALGDESVAKSAGGSFSEDYTSARAQKAAEQSDNAIAIARLFGMQNATSDALLQQQSNALNPRLEQAWINGKRRALNGSYDFLGSDINNKAAIATRVDTSKGQLASGVGGTLLNYGLSSMGKMVGESGAGNNLFK